MHKSDINDIDFYKRVLNAKTYIDKHFDQRIDLDEIARQACFSKFHFHRAFKASYGKTPLEYLTYLRLREAKTLLSLNVPTQEVCALVGFESVSSFIKLFKRKELLTPSEFAKITVKNKMKMSTHPLNYIPSAYAEYLGWKIT